MLAILILLMGCTTTNPENLPDWAGLRMEGLPVDGGGYLAIYDTDGGEVWRFDKADGEIVYESVESLAWAPVLDLMSETRAVLTSWSPEGEPCTDVVEAVGDGFELTVCGEPFTLLAAEPDSEPAGGE